MAGVSIQNLTRRPVLGRRVFSEVAKHTLPGWDISLAFVGATRARALNRKLRKKEYVPNVLSYVVGDRSAEIIICPSEAAKQAPAYQLPVESFLLLLFIHGALHIKGWVHGVKMDKCEQRLLARYEKTHSHRHRYRHLPGKTGRR